MNATEIVPTMAASYPPLDGGRSLQQVKTSYTTAVAVQKPRALPEVEKRLMIEADQAGEDFYYGWGAGKDRVEGASIGLAMAAVRNFGNCAVELAPVQETGTAWIFTASFVDLETGFTLQRQFRQSKSWTVYGKFDEARKEDIRFQIGQSKAIRNVVLNAIPKWLTSRAMDKAKGGVREKIEKQIAKEAANFDGDHDAGRWSVIDKAMVRLNECGVDEDRVLAKFGRNVVKALTVEDLVCILGDVHALKNGLDTLDNLYPEPQINGDDGGNNHDAEANDVFGGNGARPQDLEKPKAAATSGNGGTPVKRKAGAAKKEPEKSRKEPETDESDLPAADDPDMAGLCQEGRLVDEPPQGQKAIHTPGVVIVAEDAADAHHGVTSTSTRSCFAGSYRLRAFDEASRILSISGSRAVAHRAKPYNPPAMSSPARNE